MLILLTALLASAMLISVNAAGSKAEGIIAPGGKVTTLDELITALGGETNAANVNGVIRLKNNIILTAPIYINSGSYKIIGGGCSIYRGFDDGALFQLGATALTDSNGNPLSLPTLTLGSEISPEKQNLDDPDLILDGNSESFKGAINGPLIAILGKGYVTINPSTVLTNNHSAVPGGAIYLESFSLGDEVTPLEPTLNIIGGLIYGNSSDVEGGAIAAYGRIKGSPSGSISITQCKIEGNTSISPDETYLGKGGAIYSDGFTLTLNTCELLSNAADEGGALYVTHDTEITTCTVSQNVANSAGGAMYVHLLKNELDQSHAPAKVTLSSNFISDNRSDGIGGAIVNQGNFTLLADKSSYISTNTAKGNGAVIFNEGTLELNSGELFYNSSSEGRGGIYNIGTVNFNGADMRMNTATVGGAIYNLGTLNYYKGCLASNKCTAKNAPQVANLGKMAMRGSFIIENDIIGLFPVTDSAGDTRYTVIEVADKITTNVKINIAFYKAITEDSTVTELKYANKSGYNVFTGLKRHIEIAASRSQIADGSYKIGSDGRLSLTFPVGIVVGCVIGAATVAVGTVFIVKKKRNAGKAVDENDSEPNTEKAE